ncbi:MAG TPA: LLM class flavin-dependent oxidoreductase [Solirubrobacteraceae bacterium]|jgi:luciferase family oxidoreductase group 1|nr:LLM class flavin-dependent oxidoreductase [Solirubrobacteraceae bacterium]
MLFSTMIVQTTPAGSPERYDEIIEQVLLAERLGYDRVWLTSHHFTSFSRPSSLLTLAHVAAKTQRIRLGVGVAVLPLEHPLRVAEDVAVLDHLSGGRVDLGVGRGIQPEAFHGFNIPMEESTERYAEALEILRHAWIEDRFSHTGTYWQVPELSVLPRPLQQPHPPIWQVGVSPDSIERAARSGLNGLIGTYMNTLDEVRQDLELWRGKSRIGGSGRSLLAHNELVYVAETDNQAEREARPSGLWYSRSAGSTWRGDDADGGLPDTYDFWRALSRRTASLEWPDLFENRSLMGSPATVAAKVDQLRSWGVDELIVFSSFGGMPHEQTCASLRLFAERVIPEFRS